MFQLTAARRRLGENRKIQRARKRGFNSQPPEGGWRLRIRRLSRPELFQLTAARRRLAALVVLLGAIRVSFNSQPPEGGWFCPRLPVLAGTGFNSQPPEGGWQRLFMRWIGIRVSTHSRPKAAGYRQANKEQLAEVSTHSRPKAAGLNSNDN